jgi:7-carboxy-7-deazaguanine synthase
MTIFEILERVSEYGCSLVEITGGEPLCQQETPILVARLIDCHYEVLLETNGSYDISQVDRRCIKIMDVKCPSSGESDNNDLANWKRLNPADQVKFVIANREDFEYAKKTMTLKSDLTPWDHILFSPVYGIAEPAELAQWLLEDNLKVRLHLQLHKFIWPDVERGV